MWRARDFSTETRCLNFVLTRSNTSRHLPDVRLRQPVRLLVRSSESDTESCPWPAEAPLNGSTTLLTGAFLYGSRPDIAPRRFLPVGLVRPVPVSPRCPVLQRKPGKRYRRPRYSSPPTSLAHRWRALRLKPIHGTDTAVPTQRRIEHICFSDARRI